LSAPGRFCGPLESHWEGKMKKYKDIIMGAVLFAVGLIYFLMSFSIKLTYIDQIVGSRMFPQICGVVLMGLSMSLAVSAVMHLRQPRPETDSVDVEEMADRVMGRDREKHVLAPAVKTLLVLVSFAVFCWLLDKIGFAFAAFLYLFSQMLLIAGRKLKAKDIVFYLVLSAVLSAGIYYLFYKGFSLMLPKASWF